MITPMKYLSADLLPKVFHGLICIIYLSYTYKQVLTTKTGCIFFAGNDSLVITLQSVTQQ
jgi:hypothetical protein